MSPDSMAGSRALIRVKDLSKRFKIYPSPLERAMEAVSRKPRHGLFSALEGVSFDLLPGQALGLVGPNGAGKSTLLRILAGTLEKTAGRIGIRGRVASILELGTGFNPDFSGRENAFLACLCQGQSRARARAGLDWIKDFSDLGEFFEKPVRTYSSGMQARLFFSAMAASEADILLLDEALSVGDARFQRRCFARMERFREKGGAIILVSHDINLIVGFCDRAMLLDKGRIKLQGSPREVSQRYLREVLSPQGGPPSEPPRRPDTPARAGRHGDGRARIVEYGLVDRNGRAVDTVASGGRCKLFARAVLNQDLEDLRFGFGIKTVSGVVVFNLDQLKEAGPGPLPQGAEVTAELELTMWLAPGEYFITFGLLPLDGPHHDRLPDAVLLRVVGDEKMSPASLVNLEPRLGLIRLDGPSSKGEHGNKGPDEP